MIVGNGLIAKNVEQIFGNDDKTLIFASGVSNSSEKSPAAFEREERLIENFLSHSKKNGMIFVYFSSCALVDKKNLEIPYYKHKHYMEQIIKKEAQEFMILRLPQLIGKSENKNTLINYLVEKIKTGEEFQLWRYATRYLIEVHDLRKILEVLVRDSSFQNQTIDIANPYRYTIEEIVKVIETYMGKQANYTLCEKEDSYLLNLEKFLYFCKKRNCDIDFGKEYLAKKLKNII